MLFPSHVMGTFGTNRIYTVGRVVKVVDRMRWGLVPARVRFPPYLERKIHPRVSDIKHTRALQATCIGHDSFYRHNLYVIIHMSESREVKDLSFLVCLLCLHPKRIPLFPHNLFSLLFPSEAAEGKELSIWECLLASLSVC